ncbi:MAG: carboxypeptidase-like regulatory domain-containing protein [Deltaproteobacteria bacterium]
MGATLPGPSWDGSVGTGTAASAPPARAAANGVQRSERIFGQRESVTGHVLDATGGSIVGARVDIPMVAAESGADGEFELAVEPGAHQIHVRAEGYSEGWRQVWAPSSGVDIVLEPAASLIGVVRAETTGVAVAELSISAINTTALGMPPATGLAAADGSFHLSSLNAGHYLVRAEGAGWRSEWQPVTIQLGERAGPIVCEVARVTSLRGSVSVAGVPCREGRVSLSGPVSETAAVQPGGTITVVGLKPGSYQVDVRCSPGAPVLDDVDVALDLVTRSWDLETGLSVRGSVANDNGNAVVGAEVLVEAVAGGAASPNAHCVSDARGEFECGGLLPGAYECWLAQSLPTAASRKRVTLPAAEATRIQLVEPARGSIVVHLVGAEGHDLQMASLVARRGGSPPVWGRPEGSRIVFDDLPLGAYAVSFNPAAQSAARVTLERPGQIAELELAGPERVSLFGRVLDEHDQPVLDAWIRATPAAAPAASPSGTITAWSDEQGAFELHHLVSKGRYDITVCAPAGEATVPSLSATNGRELLLRLPQRSALSARVIGPDGEPVEHFTLAYRRRGEAEFVQDEGANGRWSSSPMAPGAYRISVASERGVAVSNVELTALDNSEVLLQVRPAEHPLILAELLMDGDLLAAPPD